MTEVANQPNSTSDKIAALSKEAENLKLKLEEERQKLNDVSRKCLYVSITHVFLSRQLWHPFTPMFHCFPNPFNFCFVQFF